jgi:hypothetical protein
MSLRAIRVNGRKVWQAAIDARTRGGGALMGLYRPTYRDKVTKERRECAVWYARYQLDGRKIVESTGCTKFEEARQWLRRREGAIATNEPVRVKADRVTFAEMAARLREDYRTNGKHLPTPRGPAGAFGSDLRRHPNGAAHPGRRRALQGRAPRTARSIASSRCSRAR